MFEKSESSRRRRCVDYTVRTHRRARKREKEEESRHRCRARCRAVISIKSRQSRHGARQRWRPIHQGPGVGARHWGWIPHSTWHDTRVTAAAIEKPRRARAAAVHCCLSISCCQRVSPAAASARPRSHRRLRGCTSFSSSRQHRGSGGRPAHLRLSQGRRVAFDSVNVASACVTQECERMDSSVEISQRAEHTGCDSKATHQVRDICVHWVFFNCRVKLFE